MNSPNDTGYMAGLGEMVLGFLIGAILGAVYGGITLPWAFNVAISSKTQQRLRLAWVLSLIPLSLGFVIFAIFRSAAIEDGPSDADLVGTFHKRQSMLEDYVRLATRPAQSTKLTNAHTDDGPLTIKLEDLFGALAELRKSPGPTAIAKNGIEFVDWHHRRGGDAYYEKGIAFLPHPPADSSGELGLRTYRLIQGDWYTYSVVQAE